MKRDVERRKKLPAFSLGIGELEVLWNRMLALFENPDKVYADISIELPTETLKFDNFEELKRYTQLRGRITTFRIHFWQSPRTISISSWSGIAVYNPTEVSTRAENEAWCAGAVDTVYSFLQSHKVWYHSFISAPLGWILMVLLIAPSLANVFVPKDILYQKPIVIPWLTITVALGILCVTRGKLLPWSTLRFSEDEGFIRRHVGELNLVLMIIAIAVTIILFFIGK